MNTSVSGGFSQFLKFLRPNLQCVRQLSSVDHGQQCDKCHVSNVIQIMWNKKWVNMEMWTQFTWCLHSQTSNIYSGFMGS